MSKARILANLRNHDGKWVGFHCVLRGLDYSEEVQTEIRELIQDGTIERRYFDGGHDRNNNLIQLPLYRYVEPFTPYEKIQHLTVIK